MRVQPHFGGYFLVQALREKVAPSTGHVSELPTPTKVALLNETNLSKRLVLQYPDNRDRDVFTALGQHSAVELLAYAKGENPHNAITHARGLVSAIAPPGI